MSRHHAHRPSRTREAIDIVGFFGVVVLIVLILSLDGIR